MSKEIEIRVKPDHIHDQDYIEKQIRHKLSIRADRKFKYKLLKKSIDSRKAQSYFVLRYTTSLKEDIKTDAELLTVQYHKVTGKSSVAITGA